MKLSVACAFEVKPNIFMMALVSLNLLATELLEDEEDDVDEDDDDDEDFFFSLIPFALLPDLDGE